MIFLLRAIVLQIHLHLVTCTLMHAAAYGWLYNVCKECPSPLVQEMMSLFFRGRLFTDESYVDQSPKRESERENSFRVPNPGGLNG